MYKIIASGSRGNAVIYFDKIMVDCGVPYSWLKNYVGDLSLVLLTHRHSDHFEISTVEELSFQCPALRFGCGRHMKEYLEGIQNVDVYDVGEIYRYGSYTISPFRLYHDVENVGYRIIRGEDKVFHATDTAHLGGLTARGYSLYGIEANYYDDSVYKVIQEKQSRGEYAYQKGAINSHLSIQQAQDFVIRNGIPGRYEFIRLHESSEF